MNKKILAIVTVIVLVISIIPISVSAIDSYDGMTIETGTEIVFKDNIDMTMLQQSTNYNISLSYSSMGNPHTVTAINKTYSSGYRLNYVENGYNNTVYQNNGWLYEVAKTVTINQDYTLHDNDILSQFLIANAESGLPVETETETETEIETVTETDNIIINNNILVGTVIPENTIIRFKNNIVEQEIEIDNFWYMSNNDSFTKISGYYSNDDIEFGYGYFIDYVENLSEMVVYSNTESYPTTWANGYREIRLSRDYTVNNIEVAQFFNNNIEYIYPAIETTNQDNVINSTKTIFQLSLENTTNIIEFILFNPIAIVTIIIYIAIALTIVIKRIIAGV